VEVGAVVTVMGPLAAGAGEQPPKRNPPATLIVAHHPPLTHRGATT